MERIKRSALLLSTMLLAAGCGNGASETSLSDATGSSDANEVTMWVQYSEESAEGQVMVQSIKDFNETNEDGITAKVEYIPRSGSGGGYEDKINAALTTNTLPDVITLMAPTLQHTLARKSFSHWMVIYFGRGMIFSP